MAHGPYWLRVLVPVTPCSRIAFEYKVLSTTDNLFGRFPIHNVPPPDNGVILGVGHAYCTLREV